MTGKLFCCAPMNRRAVLGGMAGFAAIGMAPASALAQNAATTMPPQPGDYLVRATGHDVTPLTPADIEVGGRPIQAWPAAADTQTIRDGTLFNLLLVSRWDIASLGADARTYAADGVVCQTAICTHAACEVTDWVEDLKVMQCPCHLSRFDPHFNGAVIQGPATRRLPALALALDGERTVVKQPFDSRVGGDVE